MSRALRSGAPRMLGDHRGASGRAYTGHFKALVDRYAPLDSLMRAQAGIAAAAFVVLVQATGRLQLATKARQAGRGRRPNAQAIARMEKRVGLAQSSHEAAVRRLEEMAAKRPRLDLARAFAGREGS